MLEAYLKIPLNNNTAAHRFELEIEGQTALIEYEEKDGHIALLHTEVPPALGGKGVAAALAEKVFQYLESQHRKAKVYCPYILAWLKKHPEWENCTR